MTDEFIPGLLTFGNFFGNGACIAWTSGSGLISIHGPVNDQNTRSNLSIDVNQSIIALVSSALTTYDSLIIAHSQALQCYDIFENKQIFYVEIENTIESIATVSGNAPDSLMVVIGCHCTIQGFNMQGKETLWCMTSGRVTSMISIGKPTSPQALLAGTDDFEISWFDIENSCRKWSVQEADVVEFLIDLGNGHFGYGLKNGTIGVYLDTTRLWRIKSKHRVLCLSSIHLTERPHLFSGWSNGKFEARKIENGEILCRESVSTPVVGIFSADFRQCEIHDIVVCTSQGFVRGYNTSLSDRARLHHEITSRTNTMTQLNQKLKELMFELESLEVARHQLGNEAELNALKHTEMDMRQSIQSKLEPNCETRTVVLKVTSNRDQYLFKGGIALGENLFDNEADFVVLKTPRNELELSLAPKKDVQTEVCLQILVKQRTNANYFVIDLYQRIPKFVMFAPKDNSKSVNIESYAIFTLDESISQLRSWKEDRFLTPTKNQDSTSYAYLCLRSNDVLEIQFELLDHGQGTGTKVTIRCDNIEIVGGILQDLCQQFGVQDLQPLICFPTIMQELHSNLNELQSFDYNGLEFSTFVAKTLPQMKMLMVQCEDHRLLRDQSSLRLCFRELYGLNQDLMNHYERRTHNKEIHSQALQRIGKQIQLIAQLYHGTFKTKLLRECRESLKGSKINSILELMNKLQHKTNI
eukprot:g5445.t1